MSCKKLCILLFIILVGQQVLAQRNRHQVYHLKAIKKLPAGLGNNYLNIGDSVYIMTGTCKNNWTVLYTHTQVQPFIAPAAQAPFLKVHGNVLYNFSYRSYIDTPFAQNDLQQHLVQTTLNFIIKDKYPVQMTITNRSSNSPYFKNLTDVNFNFNRRYLLDNIKNGIKEKAIGLVSKDALLKTEQLYARRQQLAQQLQAWVNSPARAQEFVEEKERALQSLPANLRVAPAIPDNINNLPVSKSGVNRMTAFYFSKENKNAGGNGKTILKEKIIGIAAKTDLISKQKNIDSLKQTVSEKINEIKGQDISSAKEKITDSLSAGLKNYKLPDSTLLQKYNCKKEQLTKLLHELKQDEAKINKLKRNIQDSVNKIKREVAALQTPGGLFAFMQKNSIAKSELTKVQRSLLSINQIGIGRSYVDYSELTVKNISLAGVNVEMNPAPFYFAFAAGKVNYRFRDFIVKDNARNLPDQSLYMVRTGIGQKEKNNFIISFYNGKKAILNYTASNTPASIQRVLGISAEARLVIDPNNYIIAEVAKSSFNTTAGTQLSSADLMGKAFNLKIHTNEAYSIKLFSQNPQTNTKLTGYYKKIGENFQSFNLFPINITQDAWMVRVNQSLWKKRFILDAAVRKNDFVSPIAAPSFVSKTIFKSLQATLRIPKYPFVSVGYYPSSQLSISNNNILTENQYNTFNAIISHGYQYNKTGMNTNAVYTKFYNSSSDTGFIYFNASGLTINHSIFLGKLTVQSSASLTDQKDLHLFTLEQMLSYQFKNKLTLGGSLKWNRLNRAESLFGATAIMNININRLGTLQFNYEKTYLPGYNRVLIPVDIGRMSFYREF